MSQKRDKTEATLLKIVIAIFAVLLVMVIAVVAMMFVSNAKRKGAVADDLDHAEKYIDDLEYDEAIATLKDVLRIDPKNEDAYLLIADAYCGKAAVYEADGKFGKAYDCYEDALEILEDSHEYIESDAIDERIEEIEDLRDHADDVRRGDVGAGETTEAEPDAKGDDTDELAAATFDDACKAAYMETVQAFYDANISYEDDYCKLGFDLVYFDDDDVPELVCGLNGYFVSLYTYDAGAVYCIIEEYPYGAGGNAGYDYYERQGIIYNRDADMAGAEIYECYDTYDKMTHKMDPDPVYISTRYGDDSNGDGMLDWEEAEAYTEGHEHYYIDGREVTKEEQDAVRIPGETKFLYGNLTYSDICSKLD